METAQNWAKREAQLLGEFTVAEVGLGSILHAFQIPLAGHFLSLNQSLLLSRAVIESGAASHRVASAQSVLRISILGALMKTFSPAGKVLTPMLAIAAQGWLFSTGIIVFGGGVLGMLVGATLLSLWGIFQPLFFAWLLYGKTIFEALLWSWQKLSLPLGLKEEFGLLLFATVVLLKVILAMATVFLAHMEWGARLSARLEKKGKRVFHLRKSKMTGQRSSAFRGVLKDLSSPLFLFSLFLTGAFLYSSSSEIKIHWAWMLLRPIAIGALVFYLQRVVSPGLLKKVLERRFPNLAKVLGETQSHLETKSTPSSARASSPSET